MASTNKGNSIPSSRSVSTFDLEPNPFEQSFASTKKAQSPPNAQHQQSQDHRQKPTPSHSHGGSGDRSSNLTISEITSNETTSSRNRNSDHNEQRRASSLIYGSQRPTISSPPLLTPGGSKRLPPILLSPTFVQQATKGAMPGMSGSTQISSLLPNSSVPLITESPKNNLPNLNIGSNAISATESQKAPFSLNLSKSGLTPNESNLRTGLTPNIFTPNNALPSTHYPYTSLPPFTGLKSDNNLHDDANAPFKHVPTNNNIGMGLVSNDVSNSVASPSFTPGLGSLLSFSPTQTSSRPLNQAPRAAATVTNNCGSQGDLTTQKDPNTLPKIKPKNCVVDPITSSTRSQQRKSSSSTSPPRNLIRKKRKSSTASKGTKSSKSSQKSTPNSTDGKSSVKKEATDNLDKDSDDDQGRKRREFLERNRVAASKFRKRKKAYIKRLEMDLKFYESEYDDLSNAMNKLCGIVDGSVAPVTSNSFVGMLETAISKNDGPSSLAILAHIKQVLSDTRYIQRNGRNPRREIVYPQDSDEEDSRQRSDRDSSNDPRSRNGSLAGLTSAAQSTKSPNDCISGPIATSLIPNGGPKSGSSGSIVSVGTENTTNVPSLKSEASSPAALPISLTEVKGQATVPPVASAVGTISSLPHVINGRQVIPLTDVNSKTNTNSNSMSEIRQSSLVNLASGIVSQDPLISKYPNSD